MRLGYNTNGLAHHSLPAALRLLAGLGYESVAITLDHAALNPYQAGFRQQLQETKVLLQELQLRSVIETGARFLLDPSRKHQPTLVSAKTAGRPLRIEFLRHAVDIAAELDSDCISLWSGAIQDEADWDKGFARLVEGLQLVLDYAQRREITLGFEPEPGMLIDTMDRYQQLLGELDSPWLKLTLDVGHLHCLDEGPIPNVIRHWGDRLVNIHIEDMRRGVHEHLKFGAGEIDFPPIMAALQEVGYTGGLHVELSRHSHEGPTAAREAYAFLKAMV